MQTHKKKIALSPSTGKPLNIELRAKRAVVREGQKVHSHKQRQKHQGCTPHVALLIFFVWNRKKQSTHNLRLVSTPVSTERQKVNTPTKREITQRSTRSCQNRPYFNLSALKMYYSLFQY